VDGQEKARIVAESFEEALTFPSPRAQWARRGCSGVATQVGGGVGVNAGRLCAVLIASEAAPRRQAAGRLRPAHTRLREMASPPGQLRGMMRSR